MNKTRNIEGFLIKEENKNAANDLTYRLNLLEEMVEAKTPSIPAGSLNGQKGILSAIKELEAALLSLVGADLRGDIWM